MNNDAITAPGQTITLNLGRRVLKSGKVTKGTARAVKVTAVTPEGIAGTFKVHGMTVESTWTADELALAL
jgi:hypothetical protein